MAVALNLSPLEVERIADEAPDVLDAMRVAAAARWTTETELLAGIYEISHTNARLLAALAGTKAEDIPKAIRIPRPNIDGTPARKTANGAELAAWVQRRRRGGAT